MWSEILPVIAFIYFSWTAPFPAEQCAIFYDFQVEYETGQGPQDILLWNANSYIVHEDPGIGAVFVNWHTQQRHLLLRLDLADACDRREQVAVDLADYVNSRQDGTVFTPIIPDDAMMAEIRDRQREEPSPRSEELLAARRAAIAAECDAGLWRQVAAIIAQDRQDLMGPMLVAPVFTAYAGVLEGQTIDQAIPEDVTDDIRALVARLVNYQIEHGPCGSGGRE